MSLRSALKNSTTLMRVGMALLVLASAARWFLHPGLYLSRGLVDFATGVLYGMAIACLLLSLRSRARPA